MNCVTTRGYLLAFVLLSTHSLAADDIADLRAARARLIGPAIVATPEYSVHSPQASRQGDGFQCGGDTAQGMSSDQYYAEKARIDAAAGKEIDAANETLSQLNRQYNANPSVRNDPTWRKTFDAANAAIAAASNRQREQMAPLDRKWNESRAASVNAVTLYVMHTPTDPDTTIVPLQGLGPTAEFVARFNQTMQGFLANCADTDWAASVHYYQDEIPFGMQVADTLDTQIIAFQYTLRSGTLSLKPAERVSEAQRINNDPARNPRLTLAGLRAENAAMSGESSRRSAEYRNEQRDASNRKPGIVYKLDGYWAQYRKPELARRIFDGDFGMDEKGAKYIHGGATRYAATADFALLYLNYADLYSARCKDHVQAWATLMEETRVNHRSELNPVTGLFEARSDPKIVTRQIDARFAPLYQRYQGELEKTFMARALDQLKAADSGERKRYSEMTVTEFKAAVTQEESALKDLAGIFPEFFGNHACTSAAMSQLGDNIIRAANSQPSAQAQGVQFKGADQESDAPQG